MLCARVSGSRTTPGVSLSVCCLTRGPTARVAAQLRLLREVADEIVVGLDTSVDEDLAYPLVDVADTLVHYPYAEPVDRPVGWVHSLCTRDWILWLDDDEIPSSALVRSVRDTIADGSLTHCYVPRRTLWRDAESTLVGPPWVPDFQLRLVLNDARVLWYPGITHWPIQAIGPHRYLDAPLYHTDLLLNPTERRRAKVRRYEAAIPGRRVAGLPMNDAYFLPEDRSHVAVAAVDEADREAIERVLGIDPWPEPRPPAAPIPRATREEVDAHWRGAPPTPDLYRGTLEIVGELDPFSLGERRGVVVRVTNRGTHTWPPGGLGWPDVRVAYRWLDVTGEVIVADGLRTPLPAQLAPGASLVLPVDVLAPPIAGTQTLVLDLLHERVRWFGCDVPATVETRPAPCVAILGESEQAATAAAAALAEVAPTIRPLVLTGTPESTTEIHGYPAAADARSYVLGAGPKRGKLVGTVGALLRSGALVGDAALHRLGRRPRLAAPAGLAFLEGLSEADALLVVGDDALRGRMGEREVLQQRSAILVARTLGLEVIVVPTARNGRSRPDAAVDRTVETVSGSPSPALNADIAEAVRRLRERVS
jgi:hypothetical protein